jgi:D-lactate dehydrogenase (cytochrome)
MKYLKAELGDAALVAMRAIKAALDPHNIMNPGKIVTPA